MIVPPPAKMPMRHPPLISLHRSRRFLSGLLLAALAVAGCTERTSAPAAAPAFTLLPDGTAEGNSALPGDTTALKRVHFRDRHGEGLLVVERSDETVDDPEGETLDVAVLTARLHARPSAQAAWEKQWQRQIRQPCPGLDLDAGWFLDRVGATDLDGDGQAEITLASHTFCGGGVDPQQIHISLIEGSNQYGIEGESLVALDGQMPFGGERHDSTSLAAAPAPFVRHLDALWLQLRQAPAAEGDAAP